MAENQSDLMEKLTALAKRRGFIFPSSEIYGGINGFWDYGPLGVELKRNLKATWWNDVVRKRDDMLGLDSTIILNPRVWEASGHVAGFTDPLVDCTACKARFRADKVFLVTAADGDNVILQAAVESDDDEHAIETARASANSKTRRRLDQKGDALAWSVLRLDKAGEVAIGCPKCGGKLTEARKFNMMFKTYVGALEDSSAVAYLRPETAQGIFANYKNVLDTQRIKLPFGIAQIGKSFRNEINPRNYTFRSREFEQMEIEFFCHPKEAGEWFEYWRKTRYEWYIGLGLKSDKLRLRDHEKDELAHYALSCVDIEYAFPFGVSELEGVANRTDFDLSQHQEHSGRDLAYFDDEAKERFVPYVIEPSGGVDRATLAFLSEAYTEDTAPNEKGEAQPRTVMRFDPRLAPIKVAVFPLVKKDGMPEIARRIHEECRDGGLASFYDEKGAVGRRYRRQDEVGTPLCVTVDGETIENGTVTVRDRDTLVQERIASDKVAEYVRKRVSG
jgi:glycyl-tRNA synthetase